MIFIFPATKKVFPSLLCFQTIVQLIKAEKVYPDPIVERTHWWTMKKGKYNNLEFGLACYQGQANQRITNHFINQLILIN